MAHYHFVAAEPYRRRVIQMGEDPSRVFNVGAPGLDPLTEEDTADPQDILAELGVPGAGGPLFLVTYHPVTLAGEAGEAAAQLLGALDAFPDARIIFTGTNADTAGEEIARLIEVYAVRHAPRTVCVQSLGRRRYGTVLRAADAVIGNSSSGIIEAPAVGTPTVNIGPRQQGRLRAPCVIDCDAEAGAIVAAIRHALSDEIQVQAARCETPYGRGGASERIYEKLRELPLENILMKRFYELEVPA
jgi:UDP-N-acetylglucosamine 2-epimerase (non-hydrolysing)/GDP/UDP-N,N'-diacetylbacillosamine 2-epimerase (hydrolysing)